MITFMPRQKSTTRPMKAQRGCQMTPAAPSPAEPQNRGWPLIDGLLGLTRDERQKFRERVVEHSSEYSSDDLFEVLKRTMGVDKRSSQSRRRTKTRS